MNTDARTQIKKIVETLVSKEWLTTSDVIVLRSFLYAPDAKLDAILNMLTELQSSLAEIETQYNLKERELFDEYLVKVSDIQHKVQRLDLELQEQSDRHDSNIHQANLLNQLHDA